MNRVKRFLICIWGSLFLMALVWPAGAKDRFSILSTEQEKEIGAEADKEIQKEFGFYEAMPELTRYVNRVGNKLTAQTQRKGLEYRFTVLDTPVINAFALPGGYVYVTRGILARLSTEDELAAVLAHEIGHVDARHGASRISGEVLTEFFLGALSMYNPEMVKSYEGLINASLGLAFLGYTRKQEREADDLSLQYLQKAGYSPRGSVKLLKMLGTLEEREPGKVERFLLSHPPTKERLDSAVKVAESLGPSARAAELKRDSYLEAVDGLPLGDSRGEKDLSGHTFYDRTAGISLSVPEGFSANLSPPEGEARFLRQSQGKGRIYNATLLLDVVPLTGAREPSALADDVLKKLGITGARSGDQSFKTDQGRQTLIRIYDTTTKAGPKRGFLTVTPDGSRAVVMRGVAHMDRYKDDIPAVLNMAKSLRFMSKAEMQKVKPSVLRIREVKQGETWSNIAERECGDAGLGAALAAYNGIFNPANQPDAGESIKVPGSQDLRGIVLKK